MTRCIFSLREKVPSGPVISVVVFEGAGVTAVAGMLAGGTGAAGVCAVGMLVGSRVGGYRNVVPKPEFGPDASI